MTEFKRAECGANLEKHLEIGQSETWTKEEIEQIKLKADEIRDTLCCACEMNETELKADKIFKETPEWKKKYCDEIIESAVKNCGSKLPKMLG